MRTQTPERRFTALPQLKQEIRSQGRLHSWVAGQVGLSTPQLSLILSGRRTITEMNGRIIAASLGVKFEMAFTPCSREHFSHLPEPQEVA